MILVLSDNRLWSASASSFFELWLCETEGLLSLEFLFYKMHALVAHYILQGVLKMMTQAPWVLMGFMKLCKYIFQPVDKGRQKSDKWGKFQHKSIQRHKESNSFSFFQTTMALECLIKVSWSFFQFPQIHKTQ